MISRAAMIRHRYVAESSPSDASTRQAAALLTGVESKYRRA
jgi:hypothetical protein